MALTTQSPQLQLVGGRIGSQARLQAGATALLSNAGDQSYATVALFHGERPSLAEIESGNFIFENQTPVYNLVGVFPIQLGYGTSLCAMPEPLKQRTDAATIQDWSRFYPSDRDNLIETDQLDYIHTVFPRTYAVTARLSSIANYQISSGGRARGNGYAPTWGLVNLYSYPSSNSYDEVFEDATGSPTHLVTRRDGKSIQLCVRAARWSYSHYVTVGDWRDDPTANLTLYRGAESTLTQQPTTIYPQRLRMRLNPMYPVTLGESS